MDTDHIQEIEKVFHQHYREWCLLSFTYLRNRDEVEDVVQDVFVKILLRKDSSAILDVKSYISKAVRNTSLKRLRKSNRLEHPSNLEMLRPLGFEDKLVAAEQSIRVNNAIERLPEPSRKVFELCVVDGLTYKTAADAMGISVNTVKYHLKRAFKKLRSTLGNSY